MLKNTRILLLSTRLPWLPRPLTQGNADERYAQADQAHRATGGGRGWEARYVLLEGTWEPLLSGKTDGAGGGRGKLPGACFCVCAVGRHRREGGRREADSSSGFRIQMICKAMCDVLITDPTC